MVTGILKKIFGSRNDRLLKQYRRKVTATNALEAGIWPSSTAARQKIKPRTRKPRNANAA